MNEQEQANPVNTHNLVCDFGKHKGKLYTRIPVSYLKWMVSESGIPAHLKAIAQSELDRRGTVTPTMDISGHAIDRASLRLNRQFLSRPDKNTGLYTWLEYTAKEALAQNKSKEQEDGVVKVTHLGICFVFQIDCSWPILKSVYPSGEQEG